jgi:hypothetical protein
VWLFAIFLTEFSPNPISPQMEWVELYNSSNESADISGYIIRDSTISNKQILSGLILPNSYFTFSFDNNFLNNSSTDIVKLYDNNNNLIDSQSSKYLPSNLTFSKQSDGTWCPTEATPNNKNNLCSQNYSLLNSPTPIPYISLKIINIDADKETVEIYNPNNFSVNLFDWRVSDNSGSIRKLSCSNINSNSNCISTFSSGYLNNNTDKLILLDPLKREISVYSYQDLKQTAIKPTSTPKVALPALSREGARLGRAEGFDPQIISASHSASNIVITKSSQIHNYLSIILMFIGSIFILTPLLFNAKFNKK